VICSRLAGLHASSLHLLEVALGGDAVDGDGLGDAVSGLLVGDGAGLALESHGAAVAVGGLLHVHGVFHASDVGNGVLADGDLVGEGLLPGRGLDGEHAAGERGLQDGLRGRDPGGHIGGHVQVLQESIVVLVADELEFSFHFERLRSDCSRRGLWERTGEWSEDVGGAGLL